MIRRQVNVSSSLGVYSLSLWEQHLLLAMEVTRVPEEDKSVTAAGLPAPAPLALL